MLVQSHSNWAEILNYESVTVASSHWIFKACYISFFSPHFRRKVYLLNYLRGQIPILFQSSQQKVLSPLLGVTCIIRAYDQKQLIITTDGGNIELTQP